MRASCAAGTPAGAERFRFHASGRNRARGDAAGPLDFCASSFQYVAARMARAARTGWLCGSPSPGKSGSVNGGSGSSPGYRCGGGAGSGAGISGCAGGSGGVTSGGMSGPGAGSGTGGVGTCGAVAPLGKIRSFSTFTLVSNAERIGASEVPRRAAERGKLGPRLIMFYFAALRLELVDSRKRVQ